MIGELDKSLFQALRAWRAERAGTLKVPPYVIFSDATLKAIAEARPRTRQALGAISGIGERRLAEYGAAVLQIVHTGAHQEQPRPRGTVQAHELGLAPARTTTASPARTLRSVDAPDHVAEEPPRTTVALTARRDPRDRAGQYP
ncbi:HRDC domain-containing protein [Deinococcus sonorensis]|uniref:HRDC domain-containing protein n=1 Tax=Deinococcus sonorensis TaxID=309891 RepID=A0ABV8YCU9_9DEIO